MAASITHVPYPKTGYFSKLVNDYVCVSPALRSFYTFTPDEQGIAGAIAARSKYPVNRKVLTDILKKQYADLNPGEEVSRNIELLASDDTFTVCTAHQPNLLTGYLYFIYKILHAIKLAEDLTLHYPGKNFVPVYYMGSEDNDIEELGTFRFAGSKYVWDGDGQKGAVGRMNTKGLRPLLDEVFRFFGPPGKNCDALKEILTQAYLKHKTIGTATQYLVNELFGRYGLIVIDPDDADLKREIIPIMKDDLLNNTANDLVGAQIEKLGTDYKIQANPRPINLFYLSDNLRERIEHHAGKWVVLNTNIVWTEEELLAELEARPERFSPNVMLRGLLQETILPDVAFIGGGAEVAYWLQLKTLFAHYNVFYPCILLRQSVMWVPQMQAMLRAQLGLSVEDVFLSDADIMRLYASAHGDEDWGTTGETAAMEQIIRQLKQKAVTIDQTLGPSADAVLAKIKHQLNVLEKKMLRAEKRKMQVEMDRIKRLKASLFPNNGLQERVENFSEYYLQYGPSFFDTLKNAMQPLRSEFLVLEDQ